MATKFGTKWVTCMGNITEMFAPSRGFWGLGVRQILPRPTAVAIATKI